MLPSAERLTQLRPVGFLALRWIGAQLKHAPLFAIRPRRCGPGHPHGKCRVKRYPFAGEAWRQVVAVGALKAASAVAWPRPALGEIQE